MGDRDLEQEVLKLFVEQALTVRDQMLDVECQASACLVHSLKGSAREYRGLGDCRLGRRRSRKIRKTGQL